MDAASPTPTVFSIEDTPAGLRIAMPAPRAVPLVVFLTVWLTFWTFGGIEAFRAIGRMDTLLNPISLFLLVWLCGWAMGEVVVFALIAFMLKGAEVVTVDGMQILLRAEALGYGFTRVYDLAHATNLRTVSGDSGSSRDLLAFDFDGKTVRFGTGLNETRARDVVEAIWERVASLRPDDSPRRGRDEPAEQS